MYFPELSSLFAFEIVNMRIPSGADLYLMIPLLYAIHEISFIRIQIEQDGPRILLGLLYGDRLKLSIQIHL